METNAILAYATSLEKNIQAKDKELTSNPLRYISKETEQTIYCLLVSVSKSSMDRRLFIWYELMLFQKATLWVIIQFTYLANTPVIFPEIFGGSISSV